MDLGMSTEQLRTVLASMCQRHTRPTATQLIDRVAELGYPILSAVGQLEHCIERGLIRVTNNQRLSVR